MKMETITFTLELYDEAEALVAASRKAYTDEVTYIDADEVEPPFAQPLPEYLL